MDRFGLAHRISRKQDRLLDRLRDRRTDAAAGLPGTADSFEALIGEEFALLVTFRRSGEPVPTPVWFGMHDGRLYVESLADAGKVKRLGHDRRVRVAPCTCSRQTERLVRRWRGSNPRGSGGEERRVSARSALRPASATVCEARGSTRGAVGLPRADTHRPQPRLMSLHAGRARRRDPLDAVAASYLRGRHLRVDAQRQRPRCTASGAAPRSSP